MRKGITTITILGFFILLSSFGNLSVINGQTQGSVSGKTKQKTTQTKSKSTQTVSKSKQPGTKTKPAAPKPAQPISKAEQDKKDRIAGIVRIGTQIWALANLNVNTFRNGDTIPEAKTNKEWVAAGDAGKPVWCYYNNNPVLGKKYGKLYNWYAVNDPRGLAPEGWTLPDATDWAKLTSSLGGNEAAGIKIKSSDGWQDGDNGTNESGFTGLPGGYRVENGAFQNLGNTGIWWSTTESTSTSAVDHFLALSSRLSRSSSPRQRGESVRCLKTKI